MPGPVKPKIATPVKTTASDALPTKPTTTTPTSPTRWTGVPPVGSDQFNAAVTSATATVTNALKTTGPSDYELIPGRYPAAVSLPTLLKAMAASPDGQQGLTKLLDALKAKTGLNVPPEVVTALKDNPAALTRALEVSPAELSAAFTGMNAAYRAGKLKNAGPSTPQLPQHFDFANLASTPITRPESDLKQIAPGIFQGDLKSDLPDAQAKNNIAVAEVFKRLSNNLSAPADQQFSVTYGGKSFTRVDDFTKALKADGYEINVRFDQRIANFAALKTVVPGSNPPAFVDVPAPVMVKTGIKDANGKEAVVPSAHSEMIVSIKSGPNTKGPRLDADIKYYQGTSGTGFFPCDVMQTPAWCGHVTQASLQGDKALKAITVASTFTDLVNSTSRDLNLYADGYGVTGVCNDSVALVEQALTGKSHEYPLLMNDTVFAGELKKRLSDTDTRDDATYKLISKAMKQLPTDTRMTPSSKARALASIPWVSGQEPFQSTVDARQILSK